MPPTLQLRQYQQEAVANWFANNGRGTLKMATGSGKTITALAIATELYQKINLQVLFIICPYCHLVNQWARESEKFGLQPILAFEEARSWQNKLVAGLYEVRAGDSLRDSCASRAFLTIITTNATLMGDSLRSQLKKL